MVLVNPQLGENIGMAARAMLNCGIIDLRLVKPRAAWLNDKAIAAAAGAGAVLEHARVFETTAEAVADLQRVYAATGRPRHMTKKVATPRHAAKDMRAFASQGAYDGGRCGVIFGRESRGLDNDDIALADAIVMIPLNPAFCSMNLAQSVMVVAYEWFQAADGAPESTITMPKDTRPANKAELVNLFEHLERELDDCGFLRVKEKRPIMVQNLRNLFQRANMTEQEARTLHGVIKGLSTKWKS
ncbi:MAG TPA: RNA methyltransferase [Rhodospirillales bacterium]|nr:RNA methyltransferase [Rhodospirillales bacterium]